MIYKKFGNTGAKVSALGFGAMRLPMQESEDGRPKYVDYDKAVPLMQRAFELGVNYLDTATFYCNQDSEVAVGKALKGWRDKVYLSAKNPVTDSYDNFMKTFETTIKKLDTDYIDFYHYHGINLESFREKIDVKGGPIDAGKKLLDEGVVKHLSFSFHDDPENIKPIIDSGYFSSTLISYNLLDRSTEECLAYAKQKGLGTVVMNPVAGGKLGESSEVIQSMLGDKKRVSSVELAFRYIFSNPNIDVALSGMENMKMLKENADFASNAEPLSESEVIQVEKMVDENKKLADLYCTKCKYCLPCPQQINIPHIFDLMNFYRVFELPEYARGQYSNTYIDMDKREFPWEIEWGADASKCNECGACEKKCPQKIKIIKQLKESHAVLG